MSKDMFLTIIFHGCVVLSALAWQMGAAEKGCVTDVDCAAELACVGSNCTNVCDNFPHHDDCKCIVVNHIARCIPQCPQNQTLNEVGLCISKRPSPLGKKKFFMELQPVRNWAGAIAYCDQLGMRLATIMSRQENNDLIAQVKSRGPGSAVWLAGLEIVEESSWRWMLSTNKFNFTDWENGQPDHRGNSEHCLQLYGYKWHDGNCDQELPFACEYMT